MPLHRLYCSCLAFRTSFLLQLQHIYLSSVSLYCSPLHKEISGAILIPTKMKPSMAVSNIVDETLEWKSHSSCKEVKHL